MKDIIPYDFVLTYLQPINPVIKKTLGAFGLFSGNMLLLLLRDRDNQPEFNGVFIPTEPAYFESLQGEIHRSKMKFDLDGRHDSWIFISEDLEDFEEKVKKACELIKAGDIRIGKPY
jgi:hypothetical protein